MLGRRAVPAGPRQRFSQLPEASFPELPGDSPSLRTASPQQRSFRDECSTGKDCERKLPSERFQAKASKQKFTNFTCQVKVAKRKLPSDTCQAEVPKRKFKSKASLVKFQSGRSQANIPNSQAIIPKRKVQNKSSTKFQLGSQWYNS